MTGNEFGILHNEAADQAQRVLWHCAGRPPATSPSRHSTVMTIGQLSERTGVSAKALRRYEDMGLVYSLGRSSAGYRLFDDTALGCVHGIQSLRALGFTEAEIAQLADRYERKPAEPIGPHLAAMLQTARQRITERIRALDQVRQRIDAYITEHAPFLDGQGVQGQQCPDDADSCRPGLDLTPAGRP